MRPYSKPRKLTPEEVDIIRREYPIFGADHVAQRIGRTRQTTISYASRLKVRGPKIVRDYVWSRHVDPTPDEIAERAAEIRRGWGL